MPRAAHSARWAAVTALTAAALLGGASTTFAAAPQHAPDQPTAGRDDGRQQSADGPLSRLTGYHGAQGVNLCLLSRCDVGSGTGHAQGGVHQSQGGNLCLLATCTVRS